MEAIKGNEDDFLVGLRIPLPLSGTIITMLYFVFG
jgi:hypothetical protein